jgi:hypothetical protein
VISAKYRPWLEFTFLGPNLDLLDWKQNRGIPVARRT